MKFKVKTIQEVEAKYLKVSAGVRYWEDSEVNGIEDTEGDLIPLRNGDNWEPTIDLETGRILNWPYGTTADLHYKVCDAGTYTLLNADNEVIASIDGYVIDMMCPLGEGFGDYIIMHIDKDGIIQDFKADLSEFTSDED